MTARSVLTTPALSVEPGSEAIAHLTIRNTGAVVDHFHIQVLGDAARWATVTPDTLPLFPDAEGQVSISFRPARASAARAGTTPFGVKVTSEVDPSDTSVEEGTLQIGAFTELTGEIVPLISHGSRTGKHQLACDNRGNTPLTLGFGGVDQEEALRFAFNPTTVIAEPGTATIVTVRAHPKKRFLTGSAKTHRFQTIIQPREAPPVSVDGSMVQTPILPTWLPKAVAAVIALAVVAVVLWLTVLNPAIKSTATTAANNALSAAGITPGGGGGGGRGGSSPTPSSTTVTPPPGGSGGGPASGRLSVRAGTGNSSGCPANNAGQLTVPAGNTFSLTDLVFQNPNGDTGVLTLSRGCGSVLFQEQLSNFRDLDFHFVNPITFTSGQNMILQVQCTSPGPPAPSPPGNQCSDGMVWAGSLKPNS
ncbi:MAG: hypothetical protein WCB51_14560 [Candidatus Dormiibacterota bacterium]